VKTLSSHFFDRILPLANYCVVLAISFTLFSCSSIPRDYPRTDSYAMSDTKNTKTGELLKSELAGHPGQTAFLPLESGLDALAARLGLAVVAEKTLDVQYYIWRGDITGVAVAYSLLEAADRGVRVRILLDDLQASIHDPALLAINEHRNIEVRMFNPTATRGIKVFELISRFGQLNRRMHNKTFIADNNMAIVGGRNIGNEYFNADPEVDFSDFDVLAVGPVVPEISDTFDLYWNSELAVPINILYGSNPDTPGLEEIRSRLTTGWHQIGETEYAQAVRESQFVQEMESRKARFYWGDAHAVADDPKKILKDPGDNTTHLGPQLRPLVQTLTSEFLIISPYFIPGDELVEYFSELVSKGVSVTIVTNSLASNDVGIVHAGYAKYRKALLKGGVKLYEYKPDPEDLKKKKKKGSGITGSSRASLHAKLFVIDRKHIFVGSLNLDPRSFHLNSELGVVINSKQFAEPLATKIYKDIPNNTYRLELKQEQDEETGATRQSLRWHAIENGQPVIYDGEPNAGFFRKLGIWFMSLFVSEDLL
jgi:putative cardiolipin synthase